MYRKYDSKLKSNVLTIFAGEYYISTNKEIISTVLGSCISVCLYDIVTGVGGMNHFMLPESAESKNKIFTKDSLLKKEELSEKSMRYGITAMEVLIAEMQKHGAKRINLQAKVFGGGKVISSNNSMQSIGDKNIGFARAFLKTERIVITKENVGDNYGRKIFFMTGRDSVFVKKVAIEPAVTEEQNYMKKLMLLKNNMKYKLMD